MVMSLFVDMQEAVYVMIMIVAPNKFKRGRSDRAYLTSQSD